MNWIYGSRREGETVIHQATNGNRDKAGAPVVVEEYEVVWNGGELMPGYASRSQWQMFLDHLIFADPATPFPKTNEQIFDALDEGERPVLDSAV